MSDDFLAGGVLPADDVVGADDPNAVDSDAFLDDPLDSVIDDLDAPLGLLDEDDELIGDE